LFKKSALLKELGTSNSVLP